MIFDIKMGTTRIVLLIGQLALKFPRWTHWHLFLQGMLANRQEYLFSQCDWYELLPVLFYFPFGLCNVVARTEELTADEWDFIKENFIFSDLMPVEPKKCSFGKLKNRIYAIDYGS